MPSNRPSPPDSAPPRGLPPQMPSQEQRGLSPRLRKFIGTVILVVLVIVWALGTMGLAQGRVTTLGAGWQFLAYLVLGLGWIVPAGIVIRWMVRFDRRPETL
ncbi:DUF2842 domain-containing protein [Ancylobacter sp. 6x-1]|uniref:DUF2842 domain-containing protein n=1 Tax=Ancylobacter crimeensis TaxID=2579147 RepID=A0ABT0DCS5_9HYPH|nr:DUF2842 domain-containing protein [Ancylobacter crimeensis]MCK0197763.1 DUF2842 domain-containing protein [Ancylobacter crimeensis]